MVLSLAMFGTINILLCGVSGGNGIREALRIANGPFLSLSLFSFLLFSNGVWFYLLFLVFPFLGCLIIVLWFHDVFASLVHFLRTGLCSFNILLSYLSIKKIAIIGESLIKYLVSFCFDCNLACNWDIKTKRRVLLHISLEEFEKFNDHNGCLIYFSLWFSQQ